jgi:hypothetical protein
MIAPPNDCNGPAHAATTERVRRAATSQSSAADSTTGRQKPESPHPLDPLLNQGAMLREFALHYVEAQKDAATAALRRLVIKAVVGLVALMIGGTILIASAVTMLDGLAELVSMAAGGRPWAGKLAVGGGILLMLLMFGTLFVARHARARRDRIVRKYESLHHAQRAKFGADVAQRAAS